MKKIVSIVLLVFILCITFTVNATDFKINLLVDNDVKLKSGELIKVNVKLNDIDMKKGILVLSATLDYDEDIFESIQSDSLGSINKKSLSKIEALDGSSPTYSSKSKKFVMDFGTFIDKPTDILQISLKVKNDISKKETVVKLKDITATDGEEEISVSSVVLKINEKGTKIETESNLENNTNEKKETNDSEDIIKNEELNKEKNKIQNSIVSNEENNIVQNSIMSGEENIVNINMNQQSTVNNINYGNSANNKVNIPEEKKENNPNLTLLKMSILVLSIIIVILIIVIVRCLKFGIKKNK